MNMFELGERLKDFSKDQLVNEMRRPSGSVPQFLVLSELQRRRRMESAAMADQPQQTTVAEDAVSAAGVPQAGLMQMARALAPKTDMDQNTARMAEGGMIGDPLAPYAQHLDQTYLEPKVEQFVQDVRTMERQRFGVPQMGVGTRPQFAGPTDPMAAQMSAFMQQAPAPALELNPSDPFDGMRGFGVMPDNPLQAGAGFSLGKYTPLTQSVLSGRGIGGLGVSRMSEGGVVRMQAGGLSGISRDLTNYMGTNATPATASRPITYQQWQEMSRSERRALGLPESVIGGQNYFNRFGVGMGWNDPETGEPVGDPDRSTLAPQIENSASVTMEEAALGLGTGPDAIGPHESGGYDAEGNAIPDWEQPEVWEEGDTWSHLFGEAYDRLRRRRNMTWGDPDALVGEEDLLPPAAEETPDAATPDAADGADGAGGTGAGGGLDSDRMLEQDKWLALAQFGLGLMSSREPTLGGAIGEAGQTALGQLREARQQAVERDLANRTLAARSASRPAGLTPSQALTYIQNNIEALSTQMLLTTEPGPRMQIAEQIEALQGQADAIMAAMGYGMGPATTQAAAFDVAE